MKTGLPSMGLKGGLGMLLGALMVAGAVIWVVMSAWQEQTLRETTSARTAPVPAEPDSSPALDASVQTGLVRPSYPNMVERPLFMSTRRPPEDAPIEEDPDPEPEAEEAPEPDPLEVTLRSVIITSGDRHAWLQPDDSERQRRLALGDELDGWTLEVIEPSHVEFVTNGTRERLDLRPSGSVGDPSEPVRPRPRSRDSDRQ